MASLCATAKERSSFSSAQLTARSMRMERIAEGWCAILLSSRAMPVRQRGSDPDEVSEPSLCTITLFLDERLEGAIEEVDL